MMAISSLPTFPSELKDVEMRLVSVSSMVIPLVTRRMFVKL